MILASSLLDLRYLKVRLIVHISMLMVCLVPMRTVQMIIPRCTLSRHSWRWMVRDIYIFLSHTGLIAYVFRSPAHRHSENRYRRLGIWNHHVPTWTLHHFWRTSAFRSTSTRNSPLEKAIRRIPWLVGESWSCWTSSLLDRGVCFFLGQVVPADFLPPLTCSLQPNLVYLIYNKGHTPDLAEVRILPAYFSWFVSRPSTVLVPECRGSQCLYRRLNAANAWLF